MKSLTNSSTVRMSNGGTMAIELRLAAPLVVLTFGHILSNLLRTMPAVTIDIMAVDLGITASNLAAITSVYHFAFAACQVPIGIALDRYSVRSVSLALFGGTFVGACVAAMSQGSIGFFIAQLILGASTSGMLICPMVLAARRLSAAQFGIWSGIILSLGNMGMLLSASPLALLVEYSGWRAGFWLAGSASLAVAALVFLVVPNDRPARGAMRGLIAEMMTVFRLGVSPELRGIVALASVSLAVLLVLRGLWVGPWLMEIKGLSRIESGQVLTIFTIALVTAPFLSGAVDRKVGHRRVLLLTSQLVAAGLLVVMACGAPGLPLANALGLSRLPVGFDISLLVTIGLLICVQPLIYAMTRQVISADNTGKAMSAINLAFFLGTAVMQSLTGLVSRAWGLPFVLIATATLLASGSLLFFVLTSPARKTA